MSALSHRLHHLYRFAGRHQKARLQSVLDHEGFTAEALPPASRRQFRSSAWTNRLWEVPSHSEAQALQEIYHDPKKLLSDLLNPLVDGGIASEPYVVHVSKHSLSGKVWRAGLHLDWPSRVVVSGVHATMSRAEENAYLLACKLFQDMGLLYQKKSGQMAAVDQDRVFNMLHILHTLCNPLNPHLAQFQLSTTLSDPGTSCEWNETSGKNHLWKTHVHGALPFPFDVFGTGSSVQVSQYAAALNASMKLKAMRFLTRNNELSSAQHNGQPSRMLLPRYCSFPSEKDFDPDYEIYADASLRGFGAYLLTRDTDRVRWLANSWTEHFPRYEYEGRASRYSKADAFSKTVDVLPNSNFFEMYAMVTACFTWKHKFVDQRVLVWSDNSNVVRVINRGLHDQSNMRLFGKLFHILRQTCIKNRIELRAAYVCRRENIAADLLSRCQVTEFREVIPEAAPASKKSKKLLFWNPLQTVPNLNKSLFKDSDGKLKKGEASILEASPGAAQSQ